jgi:hypothetical protein
MAQTAVEWLIEQINGYAYPLPFDRNIRIDISKEIIDQAKEMEKEQIMKAVDRGFDEGCKHPEDITLKDAEQYYNETYGNNTEKTQP